MKKIVILFVIFVSSVRSEKAVTTPILIISNNYASEAKQLFGTTTVTVTSAVTITSSTKTSVTCAKLVNVTGACSRRRRGMLKEKPVIISFNDDIDRAFQILFTPRIEIEPTTQPNHEFVQSGGDGSTLDAIVSSIEQDSRQINLPFLQGLLQFVASVASAVGELIPPILRPTQTTITETVSETQTVSTTSTFTETFFVQRCTPSPFSFKVCGVKSR